jgi:hypothetical protein
MGHHRSHFTVGAVYLIVAVLGLANYSGNRPVKGPPTEVKALDKTDTTEGAGSLTTWEWRSKKQYILWMCVGSFITILKTEMQD